MKRLTHAGEECHKVLKAFVHSKCFADCRIHHNNLGRVLSLQFCSEMIWPGLLCKTVTELRLESWISELSPGNVGGTSIFSFRAAVMMPLCCPELAALEQKGGFYCQILPIKKSLVYHLAVVCLLSSVLWCPQCVHPLMTLRYALHQNYIPLCGNFMFLHPPGCDLALLSNLQNGSSLSAPLIILPDETGSCYLMTFFFFPLLVNYSHQYFMRHPSITGFLIWRAVIPQS